MKNSCVLCVVSDVIRCVHYSSVSRCAYRSATSEAQTPSTSSAGADVSQPEHSQPPNKKLRLLENLDSEPEDEPVHSGGNDDIHNVLKDIAAYLVLTQEEKLPVLLYWKRHCEVQCYFSYEIHLSYSLS